jgi:hypothetical protein
MVALNHPKVNWLSTLYPTASRIRIAIMCAPLPSSTCTASKACASASKIADFVALLLAMFDIVMGELDR